MTDHNTEANQLNHGAVKRFLQQGLSSEQANKKMCECGENRLPEVQADTVYKKLLQQYRNPLIYILLFALSIEVGLWLYQGLLGYPVEAIAILVILLVNGVLGFWQGMKSDSAMKHLIDLTAPKSWVVRDGHLLQIESYLLVPDDIVKVDSGERIPADAVILQGESFLVDESVLTGESAPVDKGYQDSVHSGTLAVRGNAYCKVTATGEYSAMGRLAGMLQAVVVEKTPLEKRLDVMAKKIGAIVIVLALIILTSGLAIVGLEHFSEIFLFAVALAVAAVPESLPAVITLALALGIERMAKRNAVVRRMSAVEALGSVTVIATDKTGTLTENKMQVERLDSSQREEALLAMLLVNDADLPSNNGDPLELGMLNYIAEQGLDIEQLRTLNPRQSSLPFDALWKYMRVTVKRPDATLYSYLKGAPEVILNETTLSEGDKQRIKEKIETYANQGFRTLAVAGAEGEVEEGLEWLGLILLLDPPRAEVFDAIHRSQQAGIRILMVTGDHPGTAKEIARQVGILTEQVIVGSEIDAMSEMEFMAGVESCNVFARMSPEHKLKLVQALQKKGEVVAVTGDGVNDAPALKTSDVGVAMGTRGSDVSREVADLVLLDDNFATIVNAVDEGRNIYENIQKFLRLLFSTNIAEVTLISVGAFFAFLAMSESHQLILPLTAAQILWINLLTDSAPTLAVAFDRNPGVLQLPPRENNKPLLDSSTLLFIICLGALGSVVSLALLFLLPAVGVSSQLTQSVVFCYLTIVQMSFVGPARKSHLLPAFNPFVYLALALVLSAQVMVFVLPELRAVFHLQALSHSMIALICVTVSSSWCVALVTSLWIRRRQAS